LPWPLYNGVLGAPAEDFGTPASYFVGQSIHFVNGIVFTILYAVLALHVLPFRNTHGGNILKGILYSVVLTVISVGILVPYAYVPKQGYGLFLFDGPDGWKLPFAVLVWHLIWGFFIGVLYQLRATRKA
jgi:hypothetical protein